MTDKLKCQEHAFKEEREDIEKRLSSKEDKEYLRKINIKQKELKQNNDLLISNIKLNDENLTQKLAMKKHFQHEKIKLEKENIKIRNKWKNERDKFFKENEAEIEKCNNFDPTSKILEILDEEKILKYKEMINKYYSFTTYPDISSIIDYLVKNINEFNYLEDFICNIKTKVIELEKEVEELNFIINFCEQNLEVRTELNLDDSERQFIDDIKKAGEAFLHIQYYVIYEFYKKNSDELIELMGEYRPEWEDLKNEKDFIEFSKKNVQRVQELLIDIENSIKSKLFQNSKSISSNPGTNPNNKEKEVPDFLSLEKGYTQKCERIKETVKKEFEKGEKTGYKNIGLSKMKDIVEPLMNPENIFKSSGFIGNIVKNMNNK